MNSVKLPLCNHVSAPMLRPLGAFEEFFWLLDQERPVHFVMAAEVNGATTIGNWRRALDVVQKRHPLLSTRIERNDKNRPCFYQEHSASIPLRVVQERDATQGWEREVELELSMPFEPSSSPLVRVVLLHEEQRAVCLVVIHHAIADGRSVAFVIRDLIQAVSGQSVDRLPVISSLEDVLGLTSNGVSFPKSDDEPPSSSERPAVFVSKENTRPRIKTLALTTELTNHLRERARQERTTVHGALSAAFALACWEVIDGLSASPVRVMSPIDTRKLVGLGEDCALLVGSGTVSIEPSDATTFWEIARAATARLGKAQTLETIKAVRHGMHQAMKQGIDVPTAAAMAAQGFAHDILLTNLGNLGYPTDFGDLQLEAVWGPAVSGRQVDPHTIGVTTTNGSLRLLQTTFAPVGSLLETVEEILVNACATKKHVMVSQIPG